jgi:tetratricopeptide (TPR) repeat protein
MGNWLQDLGAGLREAWGRLADMMDFESAWIWLQTVLADGPVREAIGVGLVTFVAVMALGRGTGRRQQRESDMLRERVRDLELKLEAAQGETAAAKRAQADFEKGDPDVFVRGLAAAINREGTKPGRGSPEGWLDPLRPALAEAYLRLARGVLATVKSEDDLEHARIMAWGAVAAAPERKECTELLGRIEEAEHLGLFRELSEADALAWRIARQEAEAEESVEARGLISRSRGPIGFSILLSGWEADELHDAAIAELDDHVAGLGEAAAAQEAGKGRAGGQAGSAGGAQIEGARVVALANGAVESEDDTEEAEVEARAVGAAGGGRGKTVVVMPVGRGRAGGRDVGAGNGGADEAAVEEADGGDTGGLSEREAGLKRLWERRRRPDMLGETHPRTLAARANMGHEAGRLGRHAEAEAIYREVLEALSGSDAKGENEHEILTVRHNLGVELLRQDRLDEAETEFKHVLGELGSPSGRGRNDPLALAAAHGLAEVWFARGKHSEAEAAFGAVWRARSADPACGPDHPYALWSRVRMLRAAEAVEAAAD